jgi:hypothetical protein
MKRKRREEGREEMGRKSRRRCRNGKGGVKLKEKMMEETRIIKKGERKGNSGEEETDSS